MDKENLKCHNPTHFAKAMTYFAEGKQWYQPVIAGATTLAEYLFEEQIYKKTISILDMLSADEAKCYVSEFIKSGLSRFGKRWRYADIGTTLMAVGLAIKPMTYLEIGVRRGRSMAILASQSPTANIIGFDMWIENYAGLENPGPDLVKEELRKVGFSGKLSLVKGDSHDTVPSYFSQEPDAWFDVITVDGDHSEYGAKADLLTVMQRLKVGGVLVFDDIVHPAHPYLLEVWNRTVKCRKEYSTFEFTEVGHGVALAVRMY